MPEPNERQIGKLLKAASDRRREQAGTPEMHSAAREMLQTEVRRQYGAEPAQRRRGGTGLLRWLPRVAVFMALGVCAWLIWFQDEADEPMHLALKEEVSLTPAEDRVQLSSKPETLVGEDVHVWDGNPVAGDVVADSSPRSGAASPALAATPVNPARLPQSEPAEGGSKSAVGTAFFKADRQAMYLGMAAVEEERKDLEAGDSDASLAMVMDLNQTDALTGLARARSPGKAKLQTAVLQNFTVINNDRVVRVIDADGSTYAGVLHRVNGVEASSSDRAPALLDQSGGVSEASPVSAPLNGVVLLNYRVVVSGTNRSLNQAVQFEGDLALTEQQVELGQNFFSNTVPPVALKKEAEVAGQEAQLSPGRLQGNAVLEDGQNIRVDALLLAR